MVKIKLLESRVGTNFSQPCGSIIQVDAAEARRMIAAKQGELVPGEKLPEEETIPAGGETTSAPGETAKPEKPPKKERPKKR